MAFRLSISKINKQPSLLGRLPRFNLDLRVNTTKIELLYTPVTETLVRVWKEKKGIVAIAEKQFSEFKSSPLKKSKAKKRSVQK
jgi:hypothetical protein